MDSRPAAQVRVATGIPGCDEILCGGFVRHRCYMLVGPAGAGKTVFSMQFLQEGAHSAEQVLYISLAEPYAQLKRDAEGFGFDFQASHVLDLSPAYDALLKDQGEYRIFSPAEVERSPIWEAIGAAVSERRPSRLVLDSVTQLRYLSTDEHQFRQHVLAMVNFFNAHGCTSLLLFEPTEFERDSAVALAVDGVIRLRTEFSREIGIGLRSLQVEKMRGSGFLSGRHPLRIGAGGISIFPHRLEKSGNPGAGTAWARTGQPSLDEMLHGGLSMGTCTLITGPTGVGKSTLGLQILRQAAHDGHPGAFFGFEESVDLVRARCMSLGMELDGAVESQALRLEHVNPLEMYPDEFLAMVRHAVEHEGRRFVMIDSLRGYELAMQEFGSYQVHIHNLASYLSRQGVTTILVNEIESITGPVLRATDLGVSHLADNILLLRYAESEGALIKVIGCLKKRIGTFEPELRPFAVTGSGLSVGHVLRNVRGILTGLPEVHPSAD